MHNQNTHTFTDRRAWPSVIAEDIQVPQLDLQPSELAEPLDLNGNISVYTSAMAVYYAPSDICGIHGMARECIHATLWWGKFHVPHYDTAFAVTDPDIPGMEGLNITRVKCIFSFKHNGQMYLCALVHWFSKINEEPDFNTGMWWVEPDFNIEGESLYAVIHLDTMVCAAHLIGKPNGPVSSDITHISALEKFDSYYVNKYIDHHAYEITF